MVNEKAIFEIGDIINVRMKGLFQKLSPQEIIESVEYQKEARTKYPELCKLAEGKEKC